MPGRSSWSPRGYGRRSPRWPPARGTGVLGAFTPTEVAQALDLARPPVKISRPAGWAPVPQGPARPYPGIGLLPSGGVSADNAAAFLDAGALAVCAGTSVVPPAAVAAGRWAEITERAREFAAALSSSREN